MCSLVVALIVAAALPHPGCSPYHLSRAVERCCCWVEMAFGYVGRIDELEGKCPTEDICGNAGRLPHN